MTLEGIVETKPLPLGTSAQKAELIALTRALELSHKRKVNVYTDLRCSFLILPTHSSIWKERGLLTPNKWKTKHATEILKSSEAVQVPLQVAVKHCPGHQKEDTEVAGGNNLTSRAAKEGAKGAFIVPLWHLFWACHSSTLNIPLQA